MKILKRALTLLLCLCSLCLTFPARAAGATLAESGTANVVRLRDVQFFGTALRDFSFEEMKSSFTQNGYRIVLENTQGGGDNYLMAAPEGHEYEGTSYTIWQRSGGSTVFQWGINRADGATWDIPVGIRNIRTNDSLASILGELGFSNGPSISAQVRELSRNPACQTTYSSSETALNAALENFNTVTLQENTYSDSETVCGIQCVVHNTVGESVYDLRFELYLAFAGYPGHKVWFTFDDTFEHLLQYDVVTTNELVEFSQSIQLPPAVRYIYYSATLPGSWRAVAGSLPGWLSAEGGRISGLPAEPGDYSLSLTDGTETRRVTLTVLDNGSTNIRESMPEGYRIVQDMPDINSHEAVTFVIDDANLGRTAPKDREAAALERREQANRTGRPSSVIHIEESTFREGTGTHSTTAFFSSNESSNFSRLLDVYVNGEKLRGGKLSSGESVPADWDYFAQEGSSRITMQEKYLASNPTGTYTIAVTYAAPDGSGRVDTVATSFVDYSYDPAKEDYNFRDAETTRYRREIHLLTMMGKIDGFEDGTFRPAESLTRAQAARILASLLNAGDAPAGSQFTDAKGHWAERYIAYCANQGIVSGTGGGQYQPDGALTGYAWAKMLFCSRGYNEHDYGLDGTNWQENVLELIRKTSIDKGLTKFSLDREITREEACKMAYNVFFGQ